jgi:fumarate reductase subunit C
VTLVAVGIFTLVLVHALLALRKFPSDVQQYQAIHQHTSIFKHGDTWLWIVQVTSQSQNPSKNPRVINENNSY